jgi:hypothetical protein
MSATADASNVALPLDRAVALTLFEFLSRVMDECDGEPIDAAIEHNAEMPALWALLAALEEVLDEPFAADYRARLKAARDAVMRSSGAALKR